jgi:hypothetical protein
LKRCISCNEHPRRNLACQAGDNRTINAVDDEEDDVEDDDDTESDKVVFDVSLLPRVVEACCLIVSFLSSAVTFKEEEE